MITKTLMIVQKPDIKGAREGGRRGEHGSGGVGEVQKGAKVEGGKPGTKGG